MKNTFLILFAALSVFVSCEENCHDKLDLSDIDNQINVVRVDQEIRTCKTEDDLKAFFDKNKFFSDYLLKTNFPNPSIMVKQIMPLATGEKIQPLFDDVNKVFGDFSATETELNDLLKGIKYHFPEFKSPEINTLVTGFGGIDLAQGEEVVFIGLDYFLGNESEFKSDFPAYISKYYTKENLPYKVALMLSKRFNQVDPEDQTLLSYMIYYGKAFYFTSQVLPCLTDEEIVEYTPEEYQDVHTFTNIIWSHFVNKQLFYEKERIAITKYVDERPAVNEIGDKCPGRIGRWLGYEIVKQYMDKNPDLTLKELMNETNAQKIFKESGYKPK